MDFVAQGLAVGGGLGELHFDQKDLQEAVDRGIVGHFDILSFVAGGIPDLEGDHGHASEPFGRMMPAPLHWGIGNAPY